MKKDGERPHKYKSLLIAGLQYKYKYHPVIIYFVLITLC